MENTTTDSPKHPTPSRAEAEALFIAAMRRVAVKLGILPGGDDERDADRGQ